MEENISECRCGCGVVEFWEIVSFFNSLNFPQHYQSEVFKNKKIILCIFLTSNFTSRVCLQGLRYRASLVAQWLRIRLPMQGTRFRALVRENPTCRGATKPVCHNYWAWALEPASPNYLAHMPQLLSPCSATREATTMRSQHIAMKNSHHSPQLEKAHVQQQRPNAAKIN